MLNYLSEIFFFLGGDGLVGLNFRIKSVVMKIFPSLTSVLEIIKRPINCTFNFLTFLVN